MCAAAQLCRAPVNATWPVTHHQAWWGRWRWHLLLPLFAAESEALGHPTAACSPQRWYQKSSSPLGVRQLLVSSVVAREWRQHRVILRDCPHLLAVAVTNTMAKSSCWRKGFISSYSMKYFLTKEVTAGAPGRHWSRGHRRVLFSGSHSVPFLLPPWTREASWVGPSYINHRSGKCLTGFPRGQPQRGHSSTETHTSEMTLVCVAKTWN